MQRPHRFRPRIAYLRRQKFPFEARKKSAPETGVGLLRRPASGACGLNFSEFTVNVGVIL